MRNKIYKTIVMISVALAAVFSSAFTSYADSQSITEQRASEYIAMYSGSANSPSAGKIKMTASLRVSGATAQITTKIYKNGSLYSSFVKSSDTNRATVSETRTVPSGSYYVLYKYQAVVNGVVAETRTIQSATFTVS